MISSSPQRTYERTKKGFLVRLHANMRARISGAQHVKWHLYAGLPILDRKEFYAWALAQSEFHRLFDLWEQSGYNRRFTPSVDRIDSDRGYIVTNMDWVTQSENSRRGAQSRHAA